MYFHSSTTSGSASLMSLRILFNVSPRQSPSSAILLSISSEAFMFSGALGLARMGMGAADARRQDLVRDVKIPDRGAAGCSELRHQLRQVVQVLESSPR